MNPSLAIALFCSLVASAFGNELHIADRYFLVGERIELAAEKSHAVSASSALLAYVNEGGSQVLIGGERISIGLESEVITVEGWSVISIDGKVTTTPINYLKPATFTIFRNGKMEGTAAPSVVTDRPMIDSRQKMLKSLKVRMERFLETVPSYAAVTEPTNRAEGDAVQPATAVESKAEGNEKPNPESEGRSQ